jgi:N-acetyl-gamma-glutamyl-phosphate reductase
MIKVGIVGCSGYTAIEAIRLLLRHPQATIVAATSRQADGSTLVDMHPQFSHRTHVLVEDLSPKQVAERCDVALCCLPHGASAPIVVELLAGGYRGRFQERYQWGRADTQTEQLVLRSE